MFPGDAEQDYCTNDVRILKRRITGVVLFILKWLNNAAKQLNYYANSLIICKVFLVQPEVNTQILVLRPKQ